MYPIGIVTFTQKDYLGHSDIGFAFLSKYTCRGYAHEAVAAVLNDLSRSKNLTRILANTACENVASVRLLKKLGFRYSHQVEIENETLYVYSVAEAKIAIDQLTQTFFALFTKAGERQPNLNLIYSLCLPDALLMKKDGAGETIYDISSFIESRKKVLTDGTLTEFEEFETSEETKIAVYIAHRFSEYEKSGFLNGNPFHQCGNKIFQFIKTIEGWKISSVVWEDA